MMLAKDKGRGAVRNSDFLDVWGRGILVLVLDTAAFAFFELIWRVVTFMLCFK